MNSTRTFDLKVLIFFFFVVNFSIYFNRRVFVMILERKCPFRDSVPIRSQMRFSVCYLINAFHGKSNFINA